MRLHRHNWQFLSKQVEDITETTSFYPGAYSLSGGGSKSKTQEVTHIRKFCTRCGHIHTQTIEGKLTIDEEITLGYHDIKETE